MVAGRNARMRRGHGGNETQIFGDVGCSGEFNAGYGCFCVCTNEKDTLPPSTALGRATKPGGAARAKNGCGAREKSSNATERKRISRRCGAAVSVDERPEARCRK